jgi:hypothetical protein
MKLLSKLSILALLLAAPAARAQETPKDTYLVTAQLYRVAAVNKQLARAGVVEPGTWEKRVHAGQAQLLESGSVQSALDKESLTHVGSKVPIAYFDPRVSGYQVQYVDIGFKIDSKAHQLYDGRLTLDCRVERSFMVDNNSTVPASEVITEQSELVMKADQEVAITASRGPLLATYLKHPYPNVTFGPDDSLVLVVTLHKV